MEGFNQLGDVAAPTSDENVLKRPSRRVALPPELRQVWPSRGALRSYKAVFPSGWPCFLGAPGGSVAPRDSPFHTGSTHFLPVFPH